MGIKNNLYEVLYLLQTFVFMKIYFFITYHFFMNIIFFIKNKYKGDNLKKRKGDYHLESSGPDCTCANTDSFIAQF